MASSINNTIDQMIDSVSSSTSSMKTNQIKFIPSSNWEGAKQGYFFGTNEEFGTGYHLDTRASEGICNGVDDKKKKAVRFASQLDVDEDEPQKKRRVTADELLAEAEHAASHSQVRLIGLDVVGIKKATAALKKCVQKNQINRIKYKSEPEKYMESELALNDEITAWKVVATSLESYVFMVNLGTVQSIVNLMAHENADIAISALSVVAELIDTTLIKDEKDGNNVGFLVSTFLAEGGLDMIIGNLSRLDDSIEEEATGIGYALTLLESLIDFDNLQLVGRAESEKSVVSLILSGTTFLSWLFERISRPSSVIDDSIKVHCAEVLASIMQHDDARGSDIASLSSFATSLFDDMEENGSRSKQKANNSSSKVSNIKSDNVDGIEILLQSIACYRKKDPATEEECEFLANCFHALSASLLDPCNVETFLTAQGPELMLRCIREGVHAGGGALRVLYFASSGSTQVYKKACEYFVEVGGLKVIFPIFLGRSMPTPAKCTDARKGEDRKNRKKDNAGRKAKRARKEWIQDLEQNAIYIIYSLTRYIDSDSPNDAKQRLVVKFVENDCEKCDRLVELLLKNDERMRLAEIRFLKSEEADSLEADGMDIEVAALGAKLKRGGDVFHRTGAICAFASVESKRCHAHIMKKLKLKNSGISLIKAALDEFASVLEEPSQVACLKKYSCLM